MTIERTYYCEGPDCGDVPEGSPVHARTASPPPYLPVGFIETRVIEHGGEEIHHFCSWPCVMKFAAAQPIPERIDA
jgi:hypothetical protein